MTWLTNPFRFGPAAPPPVVATDRWRIITLSSDYPNCSLAEVEMAGTVAGADLCTGGTPFGINVSGGGSNTGLFANDGDTTFAAAGNGSNDEWGIGYTFASPVLIAEIRLQARTGGGRFEAPMTLLTQLSTDAGATWSSVSLFSTLTDWADSEVRAFLTGGTLMTTGLGRSNARGWRIKITESQSGLAPMVGTLAFAATPGGATLCTGGASLSNWGNTFGDRRAREAFDGSTTTRWMASSSGFNNWRIGYGKQTPMGDAVQCRITNVAAAENSQAPKAFTVQYSEDLFTWTDVASFSGLAAWGDNETRNFSI